MYHRTRWTPEKIKQRLGLIAPLVYRKQKALPSFRYRELNSPLDLPPSGIAAADSAGRFEILHDPQDWLEPVQPAALRHVHVAGH